MKLAETPEQAGLQFVRSRPPALAPQVPVVGLDLADSPDPAILATPLPYVGLKPALVKTV